MIDQPGWVPGVRKIAVLRANAIGDFVVALPALQALHSAYPEARIVLMGKSWHHHFLTGRPGPISRVIPVPPSRGVSCPDTWQTPSPAEELLLEHFFSAMQAEHFDLALQMHGGGGFSNPFVLKLGANLTAGMKSPTAAPLDRWIPYIYWQHEVMRLLEVARLVGAPPVAIEPHLAVTRRDLEESFQALPETDSRLVVLHPGASDPRRRWPARNFAQVGDALRLAGVTVAIVGIDEEREVAARMTESMREQAVDLCGKLSLPALAGLLSRAHLVVANDSGPRHLAEAVGTPTVGIFWCGNLINAGAAFRTFHRPHLSWRLDCPVCGQNTIHNPCGHSVSFVDQVSVEEVVESALDVLALGKEKDQVSSPVVEEELIQWPEKTALPPRLQ
jgi:ADP-heptose:LPS heptosyltransferase